MLIYAHAPCIGWSLHTYPLRVSSALCVRWPCDGSSRRPRCSSWVGESHTGPFCEALTRKDVTLPRFQFSEAIRLRACSAWCRERDKGRRKSFCPAGHVSEIHGLCVQVLQTFHRLIGYLVFRGVKTEKGSSTSQKTGPSMYFPVSFPGVFTCCVKPNYYYHYFIVKNPIEKRGLKTLISTGPSTLATLSKEKEPQTVAPGTASFIHAHKRGACTKNANRPPNRISRRPDGESKATVKPTIVPGIN